MRFSELTQEEKAIEQIRWICVVPAALVIGLGPRVIVSVVIGFIRVSYHRMPLSRAPEIISDLVLARDDLGFHNLDVFVGPFFVVGGALTAPRHRSLVALALTAIWSAYCFMNQVLVRLDVGDPHFGDFALAVVLAAGGVAYVVHGEISRGKL